MMHVGAPMPEFTPPPGSALRRFHREPMEELRREATGRSFAAGTLKLRTPDPLPCSPVVSLGP